MIKKFDFVWFGLVSFGLVLFDLVRLVLVGFGLVWFLVLVLLFVYEEYMVTSYSDIYIKYYWYWYNFKLCTSYVLSCVEIVVKNQ